MSFSQFVKSHLKSGEAIAAEMTAHKVAMLKRAVEDSVVESERLDLVKKHAIYNKYSDLFIGVIEAAIVKDVTLTAEQCNLLHVAIGIAGEAGELLDAVRKHVFEAEPLDRQNVVEELGDLDFYIEAARQAINSDIGEIVRFNIDKLSKRYQSGYSDKEAQDRADKAGAE